MIGTRELQAHPGACDTLRVWLPSWDELIARGDVAGNIPLFVPLGACAAWLPRSRGKAVVVIGALARPFLVAATQLQLPALNRQCETADAVEDLTGLIVGPAPGAIAGWIPTRGAS